MKPTITWCLLYAYLFSTRVSPRTLSGRIGLCFGERDFLLPRRHVSTRNDGVFHNGRGWLFFHFGSCRVCTRVLWRHSDTQSAREGREIQDQILASTTGRHNGEHGEVVPVSGDRRQTWHETKVDSTKRHCERSLGGWRRWFHLFVGGRGKRFRFKHLRHPVGQESTSSNRWFS